MVRTMVQQAEIEEEEDYVVVEVVAMEVAEEGIMAIGNPMRKVTQRMTFSIIIVSSTGI